MEASGLVDLVLLAVVIAVVYPFVKTQLRKVLGKSDVTTIAAVVVCVAILKYGTQATKQLL